MVNALEWQQVVLVLLPLRILKRYVLQHGILQSIGNLIGVRMKAFLLK